MSQDREPCCSPFKARDFIVFSIEAKYDHRQMYYIGANSESVEQDVMHAYDMAYGLFFIMAIFDRC